MLNEIDNFDLVLVYKLDRLTRSVKDLLEILELFENKNVLFRSATEVYDTTSAMGRLFVTLVGAMAEWSVLQFKSVLQWVDAHQLEKG